MSYHGVIGGLIITRRVSVAIDEGPSSKLALSEGRSRGNIES